MDSLPKEEQTEQKRTEQDLFLEDLSNLGIIDLSTKSNKNKTKGLRGKKKLMALALIKRLGSITQACKDVGINRGTHYDWLKTDKRYQKAVDDAEEVYKDAIEDVGKQVGLVDRQPTVLLHLMKSKLRDRGYGEHVVTEEVGKTQKITLEIINTDNAHKNNESLSDERELAEE
jgi:hypothetical protein